MTPANIRIINQLHIDQAAETSRLIDGLRNADAHIEPKYFYDPLGCALYGAICNLDEYYPTRTERSIFGRYRNEIAERIGHGGTFVDLGAGDCAKAQEWLPHILPARYLAVDIAGPSLEEVLINLSAEFPAVEMLGLVTDFSQTLTVPGELLRGSATVFYPGSSIGNFAPPAAIRFLREMRATAAPGGGGLLIGVDAKKDKARLDAAYDDALGVTAAFNLNALRHINRVHGCDFDIRAWRHVGFYNESEGRVEMHLESMQDQVVVIAGQDRAFRRGEKIHSENAYKYHQHEFVALLTAAGFEDISCWSNDANEFWVFYAK